MKSSTEQQTRPVVVQPLTDEERRESRKNLIRMQKAYSEGGRKAMEKVHRQINAPSSYQARKP
jgi:ribosome recycling factor